MALQKLSLKSLGLLDDGKPSMQFDKLLQTAAADCFDRYTDDRPRRVTLQIDVTPIPAEGGCSNVDADIQIICKLPTYRTNTLSLGVRQSRDGGMFVFSEASPENVDQSTLEFEKE